MKEPQRFWLTLERNPGKKKLKISEEHLQRFALAYADMLSESDDDGKASFTTIAQVEYQTPKWGHDGPEVPEQIVVAGGFIPRDVALRINDILNEYIATLEANETTPPVFHAVPTRGWEK